MDEPLDGLGLSPDEALSAFSVILQLHLSTFRRKMLLDLLGRYQNSSSQSKQSTPQAKSTKDSQEQIARPVR